MRLKFCQFGELEVLWCVEVFVRKAYMVDAAETCFARVMHSVKTIILQKLQIINHLKFYPLQRRLLHTTQWIFWVKFLSWFKEREKFEDAGSFRKAVKNPVLVAPVSLGWLISGKLPLKLSSDKMFVPSKLCKSLKTLFSPPSPLPLNSTQLNI